MATTYAAYYNLSTAQNSEMSSRRSSQESKASVSSKKSRLSLKNALDFLRPTTETLTPAGIYAPVIKQGPLFEGLKPAEEAQKPTPIYSALTQRDRPLFGRSKKSNSSSNASSRKQSVV